MSGRSPSGARLRALVLAAAGIALAALAWRDAATEYWMWTAPTRAPAVIEGRPRIALASHGAILTSGEPIEAARVRQIAADAKASLAVAPLDAAAVRQLALVTRLLGSDAFTRQFALAERLSRRDVPTQSSLFALAAMKGDYALAMRHLDRVVTVRPSAGQQVYLPLAAALSDVPLRRELAAYARRPWFLDFLVVAVERTPDPADAAALMTESGATLGQRRTAVLIPLLRRLLESGRYDLAHAMAQRHAGANAAALDDFALVPAATEVALRPLTWRLISNDVVRAGLGRDGWLTVEIQAGKSGVAAERATGLPAGVYVLRHELAGGDDASRVRADWRLFCNTLGTARPGWRQVLPLTAGPARHDIAIEIPEGCPLQFWRLGALAEDGQATVSFRARITGLERRD